MPGLYSHTTRGTGTVLTSLIYNSDHQNHIDNHTPQMVDDYSSNATQMQSMTDPGEAASESLATSLAGELERLRFSIQDLKTYTGFASAQWYSTPTGVIPTTKGGTGQNSADIDALRDSFFSGSIKFTGDISPAQITASQNDYNPTSLSTSSVLRLNSNARWSVTGLQGGADGRVIIVHNVGTFPIVFTYEDAASSAANRFAFGMTLGGGQSMEIQYDATSSRWRAKSLPEPIGVVKDFGGTTVPAGYLACDGSAVSRTTYAPLFNEVGTPWGVGDGATTFNVPDFRDKSVIGSGTGTVVSSGVDADVDLATNRLTVASNNTKWVTGMSVLFTLSSGTITGLSDSTIYYVIRTSATTVALATTLALAQAGTGIDLTAKSSPVWTITHTYTARTLGEYGGEETHAMSDSELLLHGHPFRTDATVGAGSDATGGFMLNNSGPSNRVAFTGTPTNANGEQIGGEGGNAALNIMQPFGVATKIIKYV